MKDLHVDLQNAYGFIPHQLISFALDFFHVPVLVKNIMKSYYADMKICHTLQSYTTDLQSLGRGIAMDDIAVSWMTLHLSSLGGLKSCFLGPGGK